LLLLQLFSPFFIQQMLIVSESFHLMQTGGKTAG